MDKAKIYKPQTEKPKLDAVKIKRSSEGRTLSHYHSIADLFEYPDLEYPDKVLRVRQTLEGGYPKAVVELNKFLALLPSKSATTMQALFSRTFDVQAITTLDIGYVMFGDDYKRGELLANLNREHAAANNDCGVELADHLPNLLRLLSKSKDTEMIDELIEEIIAPALRSMRNEFVPD